MTRRWLLACVAMLAGLNGGCALFQSDEKAARAKAPPIANEDWEKGWKAPK